MCPFGKVAFATGWREERQPSRRHIGSVAMCVDLASGDVDEVTGSDRVLVRTYPDDQLALEHEEQFFGISMDVPWDDDPGPGAHLDRGQASRRGCPVEDDPTQLDVEASAGSNQAGFASLIVVFLAAHFVFTRFLLRVTRSRTHPWPQHSVRGAPDSGVPSVAQHRGGDP